MNAREAAAQILRYGPPTQVHTPLGIRIIRRAMANREFWALYWQENTELKRLGVTFRQVGKEWWVTEWTVPACEILDVQRTIPEHILSRLLKWQPAPTAQLMQILDRRQFGADFSDAGTGKTAVGCAVPAAMKRPMVVMCAKYATPQWEQMAKYMGTELLAISHWEMVRMGKTSLGKFETMKVALKTKVKDVLTFVWNPEFRKAKAVLVIDEIHNCGGISTQNSLMAIGTKLSGLSTLGLSATAADTPLRMQVLAYLLGMIRDPGHFFGWARRHGVTKGKYGFQFFDQREPDVHTKRAAVMKGIHQQIFGAGLAVRVRKADIPGFPANQVYVEGIDCSGAEARIDREYQTIARTLQQMQMNRIKVNEAKRTIVHARQKIELLKVPTVVDMVEDEVAQGFQVVVFVNYRDTAIALGKALKVPIFIGGQSTEERFRAMRGFQGAQLTPPDHMAVVSTYGAGSESINLQDEFGWGARKALLFPTFRSQHIVQAANRIHRATSKTPSVQRFVFAWGTVEAATMEDLRHRIAQLDNLNDGESLPMPDARMDGDDGD